MKNIKIDKKDRLLYLPRWFYKVTTEPNKESYRWHNRSSLFASLTVLAILVARFSPLQLLKLLHRSGKSKAAPLSQERRDFHSLYSEWYFIFLLILSVTFYSFQQTGIAIPNWLDISINVLLVWLLIEVVIWLFYYSFYRILIERKFSIYSLSEYLVAIPFVITYQLVLITCLFDSNIIEVGGAFFQYGTTNDASYQPLVGVLRTVYFSLLIAYLVSFYPKMKIKQNLDFVSIGDSNAYQKYYKESVQSIPATTIKSFSPVSNDTISFFKDFTEYSKKHDDIYVISTPTPSHYQYICQLANENRKFFIEKPLVANQKELERIEADFDALFKDAFCLQYYLLEKALSITYLQYPYYEYESFLRIGEQSEIITPIERERLLTNYALLGSPKRVTISILEGKERSHNGPALHWSETKQSGGILFDLGIHATSLLRLVTGVSGNMEINSVIQETSQDRSNELDKSIRSTLAPTYISANGSVKSTSQQDINWELSIGKHINNDLCQRSIAIEFSNGQLFCNLDTQTVHISSDEFEQETLSTQIDNKYSSMFHMGIQQFDNQLKYRVDIPHVQIQALKDLFELERWK